MTKEGTTPSMLLLKGMKYAVYILTLSNNTTDKNLVSLNPKSSSEIVAVWITRSILNWDWNFSISGRFLSLATFSTNFILWLHIDIAADLYDWLSLEEFLPLTALATVELLWLADDDCSVFISQKSQWQHSVISLPNSQQLNCNLNSKRLYQK